MTRDVRAPLLAAAATLMAMLALSPLLADRAWLQPVALVVLAVGLTGSGVAAAGLPRWVGPPAGTVAGLVIATALLVPTQAALAGFVPTRASLEALGILLRSGLATSQAVLPPAPTDAGMTALLTLSAGAVAVVTVLVAGPLRRPGAAGLPLLLVLCVGTALSPGGIGLVGFLGAAVGYLGLTLTDGDERVRGWGEVLARQDRSGRTVPSGVTENLATAAAVTSVVALLVGAVLPALTPGSGTDRLQRVVAQGFGEGGSAELTTVNPFPDIREDLESQSETVLLRYATTDETPDPLRIVTADQFDGAIWRPSDVSIPSEQDVASGLPAPPGTSARVLSASSLETTSVSIGPLAQSYLPLPYPAAAVDVPGRWLYDARTLNVLATDDTTEGLAYTASSYDIRPDREDLRDLPASGLDPLWTELPPDMSDVVLDEALRVTAVAGATTAYEQALALQQWFRNSGGFVYSLDAPTVTDRDAVAAFLEDRRGYCVQFASTMALMSRSLGIPARVAIGFLPGEELEPGQFQVRANDAHAWPELYFEGVGWVRFEPTPGTRTGSPPGWAIPRSDPAVPQPSAAPTEAGALPDEEVAEQPTSPNQAEQQDQASGLAGAVLRASGVLLLALLVLTGVALTPRTARWWRSRRRLARAAGDPARLALLWWTELLERLADLGVRPRGTTVREQAEDLVRGQRLDEASQAALGRLVEASERALFAVEPAPTDALPDDVDVVRTAVATGRDERERRRATWFPAFSPDLGDPQDRRATRRPDRVR